MHYIKNELRLLCKAGPVCRRVATKSGRSGRITGENESLATRSGRLSMVCGWRGHRAADNPELTCRVRAELPIRIVIIRRRVRLWMLR